MKFDGAADFICADTEDNSIELLAAGRSGFEKTVTRIAAKTASGNTFCGRENSKGKFLTWLDSQPGKYVWCHNLQYDLGNIFTHELHRFALLMVGGRLITARGFGKVWVDSFNIWPMALAKLGEKFDLAKGRALYTGKKLSADEIDAHVIRDVEILRQAMIFAADFSARFKMQRLPNTLGGLCVGIFRGAGLRNVHDASLFARAGLFGGRVELFQQGGAGNIFYTDINSLYPACMTLTFPRLAEYQKRPKGYGVAWAIVEVPESKFAPLPLRRADGAIYYPCGRFEGVWTYAELQNAVDYGTKIIRIVKCYGAAKGEKYYAPFVDKLFKLRAAADSEPEKLMLKLCMNNLYGRLAIGGEITRNRKGTLELYNSQMPLPEFTNYLHAAHVTSYGRLNLWNYFQRVGPENMIYCDTDGIFFFSKDQPPFQCCGDLGKMKLEKRVSKCYVFSPKMYVLGFHAKAKGVKRRYAARFIREGEVEISQPYKLRETIEYLTRGTGEKKQLSVWRKVIKTVRIGYDKKTLRDGQYSPIILGKTISRPVTGRKAKQPAVK